MRRQQLQQRRLAHRVRLVPASGRVSSAGHHDGLLLHVRRQRPLAQHQETHHSHARRQVSSPTITLRPRQQHIIIAIIIVIIIIYLFLIF